MTYARLDSNNVVIEVAAYSNEDYSILPLERKMELISCPEEIEPGYQLRDIGWLSVEEVLDEQFLADTTQYKEHKCDLLNARFDDILLSGFQYSNEVWYKGDIRSQLWALGFMFALSAGIMQPPINWITKTNDVTQFQTIEEFSMFISYFLAWGQTTTFNNFQAKEQIRQAATRLDVDTIFNEYVASTPITF